MDESHGHPVQPGRGMFTASQSEDTAMTRCRLLPLPVALLLAACATTEPPPMAGHCDADAAQRHVGHAATAEMVEAARKDAGADRVRTLKPGQVVTMEYLAGRLNVYLDADGRIERIACG